MIQFSGVFVPRSMNINPDVVERKKNLRIGTEFYFSFWPKMELGDSNWRSMYLCKCQNNRNLIIFKNL